MRWTRGAEIDVATMRWVGWKVVRIARAVGRTEAAVRRRLSKIGLVVDPSRRRTRGPGKLLAAVRSLLASGRTGVEIADRLGVDASVVSRYRNRLGHPPADRSAAAIRGWDFVRRTAPPGTFTDPAAVAELATAGYTCREIAAELGCSPSTVSVIRRRSKLEMERMA